MEHTIGLYSIEGFLYGVDSHLNTCALYTEANIYYCLCIGLYEAAQ